MAGYEGVDRQVVDRLVAVLRGRLQGATPGSMSEMERTVRVALQEVGLLTLSAWLEQQEGSSLEHSITCRCGGTADYQCKREGVLVTSLGKVHYKRAYYLCPACHKGTFPLDERLGLRPGEMSAELESLLGMVGALMPFGKGTELFERLTLVKASPQSTDKATEAMGGEVMRVEEEWKATSQDAEAVNAQERVGKIGPRLYGSLDAVKYHDREKRSEDDEGWRDLKVGVWFETDAKPPSKPDEDWDIRARNITYYCDILEAEKFGELVWATGFQRKALQAKEIVFLGDGADWIWNLVSDLYPQAVQIVDWFHATEHLGTVAKAAYGDLAEQKAWLSKVKEHLWAGSVDEVIKALEALAAEGKGGGEPAKAVAYFKKHRQRMDYAAFRAKGYQIGSGTVESGCKQMGIQRMKIPGAIWSTEGSRRTAKARAAFLSGQWETLASRREHLPRAA